MSRVYEALKNAQEQRTPRGTLEGMPTSLESPASDALSSSKAARRIPEILSAVRSEAPSPARPLQFDDLLERCAKPAWKPSRAWNVFSGEQSCDRQAEQFRTLRARLYSLRETRPIQTLLVTSTTMGEGK